METRRLWKMWWSGLFALAAFIHLLRALGDIPVTIWTVAVPMWVSWVVVPVAGLMSGWLMWTALKREGQRSPHPPTVAGGGLRPKSISKAAEPQHAGQRSSAPDGDNDWPDE